METTVKPQVSIPLFNVSSKHLNLEDIKMDSNFAMLLCSLVLAVSWVIYITYYNSRVVGYIITKSVNKLFISEGFFKIGSLTINVLSGKIMFRDVVYITPDYTVRVQDGYLIFRWWRSYVPKDVSEAHTYQEVEVLGELNRENPQLQGDLNMSVTIDDEPQVTTSIAEQKPRSSPENTTHLTSPCMKSNVWDKNQTLLLLDLCEVHKGELNSPKFKKTEIYKVISSKMLLQGHQFSAEQIANRRKTLITKFKEIKDHNSRTGNDPKEWPYYDIMANYLDDRPGISPPASCSSISKSKSSYIPPAQTEVSDKASQPGTSQEKSSEKENVSKKRKVHARSSPRTEMVQWLKDYKRDVERREERRLELAQEQHTKTTSVLNEILTLLKDKE